MGKSELRLLPSSLSRLEDGIPTSPPSPEQLHKAIQSQFETVLAFAGGESEQTFKTFEKALVGQVFELARLLVALFFMVREQREQAGIPSHLEIEGRRYQRRPAQARNFNTLFGVVRYWRTYVRGPVTTEGRRGFHPLDVRLGLTTDRMSMNLLSLATRLATKLSFAQTHAVLGWFLLKVPSTEVIEQAVLGLGKRTAEWFEKAPAPAGDGEVLLMLFDGKASPTATKEELERRRGKRRKVKAKSQRHRGRKQRAYYGSKKRRKKGDKSKNGRVATMVVMYTLKREGKALLGPINRRVYASFAPKRHAFEVARREANKRGFTPGSKKLIQIVTDGDEDLALNARVFFPEAIHTIDVFHVIEYLWKAGKCLHREGSTALNVWVEEQKDRLYRGDVTAILSELRRTHSVLPATGPGNSGKRKRLAGVIEYLAKRTEKMNYGELIARDLEIGSGIVEGAIKNIIGGRFDQGGMRWIKERAEALLQLRCLEVNGDWESFIDWVHEDMRQTAGTHGLRLRLQQAAPAPLPKLAEAA
jgi:hypothetical protein